MNRPSFPHGNPPPPALARYGSVPESLLSTIADSVISGGTGQSGVKMMMGGALGDSSCRPTGLSGRGGSPLVRHSSSPADFFTHLMLDHGRMGQYSLATNAAQAMANRRLKSQLSFSRHDTLSQISELSHPEMGESIGGSSSDETAGNARHSYMPTDFPIGSWDESSSIDFSGPPSKRAKDSNGDINLSCIDSEYSVPNMSHEMASIENFLQAQQGSVPLKARAKRGCATHPRSIAERDRRTRISNNLKKVQELVPNMDKQTSIAEMLASAVERIKELQNQVKILNEERASCTCRMKKEVS